MTLTLDVDPEAWALEYGVEGAAAIRADVRLLVTNLVNDHLEQLGVTTPPAQPERRPA